MTRSTARQCTEWDQFGRTLSRNRHPGQHHSGVGHVTGLPERSPIHGQRTGCVVGLSRVTTDGRRVAVTDESSSLPFVGRRTGRKIETPPLERRRHWLRLPRVQPGRPTPGDRGLNGTCGFGTATTGAPLSDLTVGGECLAATRGTERTQWTTSRNRLQSRRPRIAAVGALWALGTLLGAGTPLRIWNVDHRRHNGDTGHQGNYGELIRWHSARTEPRRHRCRHNDQPSLGRYTSTADRPPTRLSERRYNTSPSIAR